MNIKFKGLQMFGLIITTTKKFDKTIHITLDFDDLRKLVKLLEENKDVKN